MSRNVLVWLGAALVAGGLLVGLMPTTAQGVSCGSAFVGSHDAAVADFGATLVGGSLSLGDLMAVENACADHRSMMRIPAIVLLVLGAGLMIAAASQSLNEPPATQADAARS